MNREKRDRALDAVRDERLTDSDLLDLAVWLTPLQRPDTALCVCAASEKVDKELPWYVRPAEQLGLMVVTRELDPSCEGHVRLAWCATEAGRNWVERFRSHWDDFGFRRSITDSKGTTFGPMPWPGLPEPYQPGTIPVTTIPRLGEAAP